VQISDRVEVLDCSECCRLSQEAFITISRTPIILCRLRRLSVPSELTLPNAVYETLANSACLPALQCLDNIQPRSTCDPLRCQVGPPLSLLPSAGWEVYVLTPPVFPLLCLDSIQPGSTSDPLPCQVSAAVLWSTQPPTLSGMGNADSV